MDEFLVPRPDIEAHQTAAFMRKVDDLTPRQTLDAAFSLIVAMGNELMHVNPEQLAGILDRLTKRIDEALALPGKPGEESALARFKAEYIAEVGSVLANAVTAFRAAHQAREKMARKLGAAEHAAAEAKAKVAKGLAHAARAGKVGCQ